MTDDLSDLKKAMQAATPQPDSQRRMENIALAKKNYAHLQGKLDGMRPTSDRPKKGPISGVRNMLSTIASRGGLTVTTALVAVGIVAFTPMGSNLLPKRASDTPFPITQEGPVAVPQAQQPAALPEPIHAEDAPLARTMSDMVVAPQSTMAESSRMQISAPAPAQMMLSEPSWYPEEDEETFANAPSNPVRVASKDPVSTFSIDVDTASYAIVRDFLTAGNLPIPEAVRVEEMVNYFSYDYPAPSAGSAFQPTVTLSKTPWNPDTQLLQIGIQGAAVDVENRPPLNLVFLIDTSGSMEAADKLPLLKQSFRLMLGQLRPEDQIAIVTYAGSAGQVLAPTPASERSTILNALDMLSAGGSTAGQAGLQQAYATAAAMADPGDVNRVILATDGDFNVGINNAEELETYIAEKRDTGTYLSVLGFGRGNLHDATMQALAQNGNGQAAYIDTLSEAQKVLVDQLAGALFPIADDVKIQVEFNPATVAEYRLIGYETRILRREDFNNDKVDAGDIGAGHQVTALYEVTPKGSPAQLNDPLRYDTRTAGAQTANMADELAFLRLRYKAPGEDSSSLIETAVPTGATARPSFASAIAGFGQLLRNSSYTGDWRYADAIALATQTKGADPYGYRAEAIQLMRLAQSLSAAQ